MSESTPTKQLTTELPLEPPTPGQSVLKVIVVGSEGVGKTSFLERLYKGTFSETPEFNQTSSKKYSNSETEYEIICHNIAKVVHEEKARREMYVKSHLFLILVPVLSPQKLQEVLEIWIPEIRFKCPYAPYIIIGTKKDENKEIVEKYEKQGVQPITKEEGVKFAKTNRSFAYIECSAKTGEGFDIIFEKIIEAETDNQIKSPKNVLEKKDSCIPQ